MTTAMLKRVVLWWMAILVLAILNGIVREKFLIPSMGSFAGLIASGLILSALIFLVSLIAVPGFARLNKPHYWAVGLSWLAMTLVFEFGFGLFIQHKALPELLEAYIFKGGNIWPLVLASTLVSPWLAARLRRVA